MYLVQVNDFNNIIINVIFVDQYFASTVFRIVKNRGGNAIRPVNGRPNASPICCRRGTFLLNVPEMCLLLFGFTNAATPHPIITMQYTARLLYG